MNNELENQLASILRDIATTAAQANDFTLEQLPDVANQYITFGMVFWTFSFVVALLVLALCVVLGIKSSKANALNEFFRPLTAITLGIFAIVSIPYTGYYVALVWFAPKIYLLDGIAGMMR
jgi:hypothetical protein